MEYLSRAEVSQPESDVLLSGDTAFTRFVPCGSAWGDLAGWDRCWSPGVHWKDAAKFPVSFPNSCWGCLAEGGQALLPVQAVFWGRGLCLLSARVPGKQFLLVQQRLAAPWHPSLCPAWPRRHRPAEVSPAASPSVGTVKGEREDDEGARRRFVLAYKGSGEKFQ